MLKTCERCGKQKHMMSWETLCDSCIKEKELERIREEISDVNNWDPDTYSTDYVICPYCGQAIEAAKLGHCDFPEAYTDGTHVLVCDECGKRYQLTTTVSYSWETEKIE